MKLIVGLGNPGTQYERTRHNAGFLAIDRLARLFAREAGKRQRFGGEVIEASVAGDKCVLLKPMRFMNCSGTSVAEAVGFYKLNPSTDVLVLVDDYALPLGSLRIRAEGSAGGHNGLTDIQRALSTQAYPRVRIGIDQPPAGYDDPADWVLGRFSDAELTLLQPALDRLCQAVEVFTRDGITKAMNTFNAKVTPKPDANTANTSNSATPQGTKPVQPSKASEQKPSGKA